MPKFQTTPPKKSGSPIARVARKFRDAEVALLPDLVGDPAPKTSIAGFVQTKTLELVAQGAGAPISGPLERVNLFVYTLNGRLVVSPRGTRPETILGEYCAGVDLAGTRASQGLASPKWARVREHA